MSKNRCPKVNSELPPIFSKQRCFEDEGHEGTCRFQMTREEIDKFFAELDEIGK